jgi:hypothetical protein
MSFTNLAVTDFDRLELVQRLLECVNVVDRLLAGGEILYLHCTAGVNRSPTVAVGYLHWCLQWPLKRALKHVQECRNCCPDGDAIRRAGRFRNRRAPLSLKKSTVTPQGLKPRIKNGDLPLR